MRRKRFWTVALVLALVLALWPPMARPTEAATYTVNIVLDENDGSCSNGDCSLRDAIIEANNNPGPDTIAFNITSGCGAGGVCTIHLTGALQNLSGGGTTIDGYTQDDAFQATDSSPAILKIEIDGTNAGDAQGLNITSAGNVIRGLVINRFLWYGIRITGSGATSNTISGNYIGTNISGTAILSNTLDGVLIDWGAQNNTVGGDTAGERNVISGNNGSDGVGISGSGTMSNTVSGNYIGTDANGTADLGNTSGGVYINGGAWNNTIERNVISGNGSDGVSISGSNTMSNTVSGNYIGTNASGTAGLSNGGEGVYIGGGAQNNTVGGDTAGERNVISDNGSDGVRISGSNTMSNTVSGNYIGTNANGTASLGNRGYGVYIGEGAHNNTVGGDTDGERNVISGNNSVASQCGVGISGSGTTGNIISGNYIGTDASGTTDLGNISSDGVCVGGGAQNNTIGGDTAGERNVISGNDRYGVEISGSGTMSNTVSGNYIGTDANGTDDRGNGWDGIYIHSGAQNNTIGSTTDGERNVISGNGRGGVFILGNDTMSNTVSSNYIGTDASGTADLGNTWDGVYISWGAHNNTVGPDNVISGNDRYGVCIHRSGTTSNTVSGNTIGTNISGTAVLSNTLHGVYIGLGAQNNTVGPDNVIAHNGLDGVAVDGSSTTGNTVTQNSIFANDGMGIDIDLMAGANGGIAAPVIVTTTLGSVNVVGTACAGCTVEVFENSDTNGEGETYVGDTTTDASGAFTVTVSSLTQPYLTATATDAISGTSKFSAMFTSTVPLAPPVSPVCLPIILKNSGSDGFCGHQGHGLAWAFR